MDLSQVSFNKDHKLEAAARDAASGARWLMLALPLSILANVFMFAAAAGNTGPMFLLSWIPLLVAFAAGAYGAWQVATAYDWAGFINLFIVLSVFVPLLKFLMFIVLICLALALVNRAGFRFSLWGALRRAGVREPIGP